MITPDIFNERAKALYKSQQTMALPKYWKSGKRKGQVRVPGVDILFDAEDLRRWLAKEIGLTIKLCPYCTAPIDIINCTIDHRTPRALQGTFTFDNMELVCKECNERKGKFTHEGFRALLEFSRKSLLPHDARLLWQRLRAAGHGFSKFRSGKKSAPRQDVFELPAF